MKSGNLSNLLASLIILFGVSGLVYADLFGGGKSSTQKVSRAMSPAKSDAMSALSTGGGVRKINFRFGNMKAWLNSDGDWNIHGRVNHTGLLCATYEVGLRFGAGDPGCTNVKWLSEVSYVTNQRQCNSATTTHTGGDFGSYIKADFDKVTCAERVIRCNGKCR
jgi:hypothetical protein